MTGDSPAASGDGLVRVEVEEHIALLTLNDPARRNCVSARMSTDLAAACARVDADRDVRAVILTGAGPVFSAGGDVDSLSAPVQDLDVPYRGFAGLSGLSVPVLAAVNGPAIGAGVNFALACDVIIAGRSARFDPRFLDVGIHPGGGHLWRTQRLTSGQAAGAMVIFGESVSADEAERIGLIWRAVDDDDLLPTARRMAEVVARRSPELVRRTKSTLRASLPLTHDRIAIDLERVAQEWSMSRPAFKAGVERLKSRIAKRDS